MKTDMTPAQLAQTLTDQAKRKADFIAPARKIELLPTAMLSMPGLEGYPLTDLAHSQLGEFVKIPAPYYSRLRAAPELLAANVNHWMGAQEPKTRRMVRTLDGQVRALLSDAYQRIDNYEVGMTALEVLSKIPGIQIRSCSITENRLYIKATTPAVQAKVAGSRRVGDIVEAGVMISNSEVGLGSISVKPFVLFLACLNGMVRDKEGLRAAHVGRRVDPEIEGVLSAGTRALLDRAFLAKFSDVVRAAFARATFEEFMAKVSGTTQKQITAPIPEVVERLGSSFSMTQTERSTVLDHLIRGGDLSQFGLVNAVTRTAQDLQSYDRATEFEAMGSQLIELPASQWAKLNAPPAALIGA